MKRNLSLILLIMLLLPVLVFAEAEAPEENARFNMSFSTLLGGNQHDWIGDVCVDEMGNIYTVGTTFSRQFPITEGKLTDRYAGGASDGFIAKFSPSGELLFSTLLGGNGIDQCTQITLDPSGYIYVAGVTLSRNFPTTLNAYDRTYNGDVDIFLTKINPECDTIIFSTYLGGTEQDHHPMIKIDTSGYIYISGPTRSSNFPITANAYDNSYNGTDLNGYYGDIFITKLDHDGEHILYSSFIGGERDESVFGIDVDPNGIVYLAGITQSTNFPLSHQIFRESYHGDRSSSNDAFLLAMDCIEPALKISTILGGSGDEKLDAISLDASGNIFIAGKTSSIDFPTTPGAFNEYHNGDDDLFVLKLNKSGTELIYGTYVGGKNGEGRCDLAINACGYAFVAGGTSSDNFPVTPEVIDTTINGGDGQFAFQDVVFFILNPSGTDLLYSTFLGGTGDDNVFSFQLDKEGAACIGGLTTSSDFPTTAEAFDSTYNGQRDAFLLRLESVKP
jgi:hypothetical protein